MSLDPFSLLLSLWSKRTHPRLGEILTFPLPFQIPPAIIFIVVKQTARSNPIIEICDTLQAICNDYIGGYGLLKVKFNTSWRWGHLEVFSIHWLVFKALRQNSPDRQYYHFSHVWLWTRQFHPLSRLDFWRLLGWEYSQFWNQPGILLNADILLCLLYRSKIQEDVPIKFLKNLDLYWLIFQFASSYCFQAPGPCGR